MAYAVLADDVKPLIKRVAQDIGTATGLMDDTEAGTVLTSVEGEINTALDAGGFVAPATTPSYFLLQLKLLSAQGTAGLILKSYAVDKQGSEVDQLADDYISLYQAGLKGLRDGSMVPSSAPTLGTVGKPSSHLTDYPDGDPDLGDQANPVFTRGKDW